MVFLFQIQLTLGLLLFIPATVLIIASLRFPGKGSKLARTVGTLIIVLSALNILGAGYYAVKYHNMGIFDRPMTIPDA